MINEITTFPQTYQMQFGFHFDETQRLLELARVLSEDVYRAKNRYSHESIHDTFVHLLGADHLWRNVIANTKPSIFGPEEVAGIDALPAMLAIERKGWRELLATLDETALFEAVERQSPEGPVVFTIWQTVQHVILHGMQHHTELARMLTAAGHSPGDIDFFSYRATE